MFPKFHEDPQYAIAETHDLIPHWKPILILALTSAKGNSGLANNFLLFYFSSFLLPAILVFILSSGKLAVTKQYCVLPSNVQN